MTDGPGVLLVGNFLSATGASRSICEELAARLPAVGCDVVTTSSKPGKLARLADMLGTAWRQRHRYAVAQIDVFSGPAFFWAEAVCASLRLLRKPYVLTLHGGNLPEFARTRRARVHRLLRSARAVTTPSGYLRDAFADARPDLRFIPNGVDLANYHARSGGTTHPRLLWLRAFHAVYNPSLAVRILPIVARRFPDVRLTMVGGDKGDGSRQQAETLAHELGVADRVEFVGPVPKREVARMLEQGDIFLNTTTVDNAPVTVIEAMASGLCIVSTNVGGIPYLVDEGRTGLLVPPGDPQAMAHAVVRILEDPALAHALSREARSAAERFDWTPIVAEWRSLLTAVAAA